jgi:uncharacterized alpha-E superfamily protein
MLMLSRVADSLYWMGRYLERAEHMGRLLEVTRSLLIDLVEVDPEGAALEWRATALTLGAAPEARVEDLVFDASLPNSLVQCVNVARENARQVREVIADEMWEHLNQAYWSVEEARGDKHDEARLDRVLSDVQAASFLWDGVTDATMHRGEGWSFLKLGKFVERTDRLTRTVSVRLGSRHWDPADGASTSRENFMWLSLLKSLGALEAYRKMYPTYLDAQSVLGFLVFDREFPRSVRFATRTSAVFAERLAALHTTPDDGVSRAFGKVAARLDYGDVAELVLQGPVEFFDGILEQTSRASAVLAKKYFLL